MKIESLFIACALVAVAAAGTIAQQTPAVLAADAVRSPAPLNKLGPGPWTFNAGDYQLRVLRLATLDHPWGMAFLPDGSMLVTERQGRLRILRNGTLDPQPITGVPPVLQRGFDGLLDIALHPDFVKNRFVYLTYSKRNEDESVQTALFRGRLDGMALVEGRDIFVGNSPIPRAQQQSVASKIVFGPDGTLYMTIGSPNQDRLKAQDPTSHRGKILRLKDDGTAPADNPFIGKSAYGIPYQPEIFTLGHRNAMGLAFNPETHELWESENGPQTGDEINIIRGGRNYGWPLVSLGREYDGTPMRLTMDGMEDPLWHWAPNPAVTGMTFYTGAVFPKWTHTLFIGGLAGRAVERVTFNDKWLPTGGSRGTLFRELGQRIRDIRQGPDGLLYVLTDESDGAVLRVEPAK